ncbi:nonsense-mediated mRNA decay protein 5 [Trichomonascus vanleenenianus]|uniref:nonsense-mediated mRNA decay protein 5 n=1 Tax=Trichomonascus vanleenenianus TaxID=2268995 RepID=UPI003ECAF62A
MDINALHTCFAATLDADINNRRRAELQLKEAEKTPGFINGCLEIVLEPQVNAGVKSAAALYLKNKVMRYWKPVDESPLNIDKDEKPVFRDRLLPALVKSDVKVRPFLVNTLNIVVFHDYPKEWPQLQQTVYSLLQSGDIQEVHAGLTSLLEMTRYYRWLTGEDRKGLDEIVEHAFGGVLHIANKLVDEQSQQAAEMLRDALKIYKMAVYHMLPAKLQEEESIAAWASLFLRVIEKEFPAEVMQLDEDDREKNTWAKCKKWAYFNLFRLIFRYAQSKALTDPTADYHVFATVYVNKFVPQILAVFFEQIQLWAEKKVWISKASMYYMLSFLERVVPIKECWEILKPHAETLIAHVIFPLLCPTDEDLEMFDEEPDQYIIKRMDVFEETPTPDIAATNFLLNLVRKRKKSTFTPILQFVQSIVAQHVENQQSLDMARQKEGALRMMGSIEHYVLNKKSPIAAQMETFMVQYVFPDFGSPFGFLRARACEFLNRYAEIQFSSPETISHAYQAVMTCLGDEHLPVQVEAAMALQPLIAHDEVRAALSSRIPEVMQKLLELNSRVDVDAISAIMEEFVEVFAEQLTPFAVQLAEQLRDQFMRICTEILEKQNVSPDDYDFDGMEDKTMTAIGNLSTLTSLVLALDNAVEVVVKLEDVFMPIFVTVLQNQMSEFYTEVFGLIENISFCMKAVSPSMWEVLKLMHKAFDGAGYDYLEEMYPCLDNFIQYGAAALAQNPELTGMLYDIIQQVMTEQNRLGAGERRIAASLAQNMMVGLKGHIEPLVPRFLDLAIDRLSRDTTQLKNVGYCVYLLEVVIAALYYNAHATMTILEQRGFTAHFFSMWFQNMNRFKRVQDKKLAILAIISIITLPAEQIPESIQNNLPQLSSGLVTIIGSLPDAVKNRKDMAEKFADDSYLGYTDTYEEEEWEDDEDEETAGAVNSSSDANEYLEFLSRESASLDSKGYAFFDEDDEDLEEEPLVDSVLDNMNVYAIFRDAFAALNQNDQARYQLLASNFTDDDQKIVHDTIALANEGA